MVNTIIVGGGIAGLCAARLAQKQSDKTFLVEKEDKLGGLFASETNTLGHVFDQGTHFVQPTSIAEMNKIIFEDLNDDECYLWSESLKEGGYFNGILTEESGCIDTRTIPDVLYKKGVVEILNSKTVSEKPHLDDYLIETYGPTFTNYVFEPILKKFSGLPLKKLHIDAISQFLISRLLVLDRYESAKIKQLELFDQKISWAHRDDGHSSIIKRYPIKNGVGRWVEGLEKRILNEGGTLLKGTNVESFDINNGLIEAVKVTGGQSIQCDRIVWTISPVAFLHVAQKPIDISPPLFRKVILFHFSINKKVKDNLHWVVCYDPNFVAYRITLYPNITKKKVVPAPHHLTVEVIIDSYEIDNLRDRVFNELKQMGLIPKTAKILESSCKQVLPGWPIFTKDYEEKADIPLERAKAIAKNVIFVGREKARKEHFSNVVLEDLYRSFQTS